MLKKIVLVAPLVLAAVPSHARPAPGLVLKGACTPNSHVSSSVPGASSPILCDTATVISIPAAGAGMSPDDGERVVVQFSHAGTGQSLAFAGLRERDGVMMEVLRLYPAATGPALGSAADAVPVDAGACKFFHAGSRVESIFCGAKVQDGSARSSTVVVFRALDE